MNLIERIKAERAEDGTCTQGDYIRAMETALLAADELAQEAELFIYRRSPTINQLMNALATYIDATT